MLVDNIISFFISKIFIYNLFPFTIFCQTNEELGYSMIKELNGQIYIGGANFIHRYKLSNNKLIPDLTKNYYWPSEIMNGSTAGITKTYNYWPEGLPRGPSNLSYDTCLNWKQEHKNHSLREFEFDYQRWKYHTPSGDWITMNITCKNSFIRGIEILDTNRLWVCGTFGAFPRAFSVNITNLEFIEFVDVNIMSCARYVDEPMVTYRDNLNNLYVGSGWGLYRPDKTNPDVPDNNSTMLYADWRLNKNLFTMPSVFAWVLSSDVNFINVVKNTANHLYFFGHEISNQYGLNNQEDRHAWQSFMLRICKKDLGFKYFPTDIMTGLRLNTGVKYDTISIPTTNSYEDFWINPLHDDTDYNKNWYDNIAHLPKTHFVTPLKINFGCYIGKRPRAISDNYFWGDTNVVYLNKLADVIFDPNRTIKFKTKEENSRIGCKSMLHHQIPLVGIFNKEGLLGTGIKPTGALCQLQINQNIFNEIGSLRPIYEKHNFLNSNNAYAEIMGLSSTSYSNFYSRSIHRTNGYTLYPFWNQGVLIGNNEQRKYYHNMYDNIGKCNNESFYHTMDVTNFLQIQNFSNTAWPNELSNRLASMLTSVCQYSAAELYSFNATFIVPGVEFKKMFLIEDNITNYVMSDINGDYPKERRFTSPLMIVGIISTTGYYYRVVLCDFDNAIANHGIEKDVNEWYNWCIFRHTDQPYLYRQFTPMETRKRGHSYLFRASSLLEEKRFVSIADAKSFSINRDPQFHIVKDVLKNGHILHVVTANRIIDLDLQIDCGNYLSCIDCASDPHCMWDKENGMCTKYNSKNFNDSKFVQDVLDRGFKCAMQLRDHNETLVEINHPSASLNQVFMVFRCSKSGFWRGKFQWRINSTDVFHDPNLYLIDTTGNILTVLNTFKGITNVSCIGIKDDYDKLFNETEYSWIGEKYSSVLFTTYTIKPYEVKTSMKFELVIVIFILIIIIICAISFFLIRKWKLKALRKRKKESHIRMSH